MAIQHPTTSSVSATHDFIGLTIAILTISDTRDEMSDTSGQWLAERLSAEGHFLGDRAIVPDNIYYIRAVLSRWIADDAIQVVIANGGTGLTGRDGSPEAIHPLLDKEITGFGEAFRNISYQEIKTSALLSRAMAGVANGTFIFCIPGSQDACRTAWDRLIKDLLDFRYRPCNLVDIMPRLKEK